MKKKENSLDESIHIGGRLYIQPTDVIMLVANVNYTTIYLINGQQFMIARTIGKVQEILHPHGQFIRTNKAQVVNLAYVLQHTKKGFVLQNNEVIDWSRRRKKEIKEKLRRIYK